MSDLEIGTGGPLDQLFGTTGLRYGLGTVRRRALFYFLGDADLVDLESIRAAGWDVVVTDDLLSAQSLLEEESCLVGVVCFGGAEGDRELRQLAGFLSGVRRIHWVALLPAVQRSHEALLDLLAQYFYDYHTLPADMERLQATLGHAYGMSQLYQRLLDRLPCASDHEPLLGASAEIQGLLRGFRKVASVDAPVLLYGESGTGKELAAHTIHRTSLRSAGPFVAVNCGALPATLIQSELFGHEKGAFTGAHQRRIGRFEAAHGGTIFLDEIGDLPLDLQVNLLRFLQERTIERVGSAEPIQLDARVIAATHVDLEKAVAEGRFRQDLYYRLNVLQLSLPPLRERGGDIELLARYYFDKFTEEQQHNAKGFSQEALQVMNGYAWPGNVRELMNRVRRAVIMSEGGLIGPRDLGLDRRTCEARMIRLDAAREAAEKGAIRSALFHARDNHSEAAKALGVSRTSLYRLMKKYRLTG